MNIILFSPEEDITTLNADDIRYQHIKNHLLHHPNNSDILLFQELLKLHFNFPSFWLKAEVSHFCIVSLYTFLLILSSIFFLSFLSKGPLDSGPFASVQNGYFQFRRSSPGPIIAISTQVASSMVNSASLRPLSSL